MLIAISQRQNKNSYGYYIDNLENNYVNYLESFGIKLIIIPNTSKNIKFYFDNFPISGIILSGGNNVNPKLYGSESEAGSSVSDSRDETENNMLKIAIDNKIPVLGICKGMQLINVFFEGRLDNIENGIGKDIKHVRTNHKIDITDDKFSRILGKESEVNSTHNKGIDSNLLSPKLKAFASSSDGIIEGIYHPSLPIVGIQWHPERKSPDEEINKKIISSFLKKEDFFC